MDEQKKDLVPVEVIPAAVQTELASRGIPRSKMEWAMQQLEVVRSKGIDAQMSELLAKEPERAEVVIKARNTILTMFEEHAIRSTRPQDWIMRKPPRGGVAMAGINSVAARRMCNLLGITLIPYNDPQEREEPDGSTTVWQTGMAYCAPTNRLEAYVEAARNSKEDFTGRVSDQDNVGTRRKYATAPNPAVSLMDTRSSVSALLHRKAVEALTGLKNFTAEDLAKYGIDASRCTKGYGFTGDERAEQSRQPARRSTQGGSDRRTAAGSQTGPKGATQQQPAQQEMGGATTNASAELLTAASSLWRQVMRCSDGNRENAVALLKKVAGVEDYKMMETLDAVDEATAKLLKTDEWAAWSKKES